ncbi:MAG: hypothetical protein ACPLF9_08900, partial [Methanothermobacter tenebrarum]
MRDIMMSENLKEYENHVLPENQINQLVNEMFKYGDLLLIGNKGVGKTNSLMVLADKLIQKN